MMLSVINDFLPVLGIFSLLFLLIFIAFAAMHRKNKTKSNWNDHSKKRSGKEYDKTQNIKKGTKNKKYKKPQNPNKKGNIKNKSNSNADSEKIKKEDNDEGNENDITNSSSEEE